MEAVGTSDVESTDDVMPISNSSRQASTTPRFASALAGAAGSTTASAAEKGPTLQQRHAPVVSDCTDQADKGAPMLCQALGCEANLLQCKVYCIRKRLCQQHLTASQIRKRSGEATLWRFCQQCGKLEPLDCFDGKRRSCRMRLQKRKELVFAQDCSQPAVRPAKAPRRQGISACSAATQPHSHQQQFLSPHCSGLGGGNTEGHQDCCADGEAGSWTRSGSGMSPLAGWRASPRTITAQQQAVPGQLGRYGGSSSLLVSPPSVTGAAAGSCGGRSSTTGMDFASPTPTCDRAADLPGDVQLLASQANERFGVGPRPNRSPDAVDDTQQLCSLGRFAGTQQRHGRPALCRQQQQQPQQFQQWSLQSIMQQQQQQQQMTPRGGIQAALPLSTHNHPKQAGFAAAAPAAAATTASGISAASWNFQSPNVSIAQASTTTLPANQPSASLQALLDHLVADDDSPGPAPGANMLLGSSSAPGQLEESLQRGGSEDSRATSVRLLRVAGGVAAGGNSCSQGTLQQQQQQQELAVDVAAAGSLQHVCQQQQELVAGDMLRALAGSAVRPALQLPPLNSEQEHNQVLYTADEMDQAADEVSGSSPFSRAMMGAGISNLVEQHQQLPQTTAAEDAAGLPSLPCQQLEAAAAACGTFTVNQAAAPAALTNADSQVLRGAGPSPQPPQQLHMPVQQQCSSSSAELLRLVDSVIDSRQQRMPQLLSSRGNSPQQAAAGATAAACQAESSLISLSAALLKPAAAVDSVRQGIQPAVLARPSEPSPGRAASALLDDELVAHATAQAPIAQAQLILAQQQQLKQLHQQRQQLIKQLQAAQSGGGVAAAAAAAAPDACQTPLRVSNCGAPLPGSHALAGLMQPQGGPGGQIDCLLAGSLQQRHQYQQQQQQQSDFVRSSGQDRQCSSVLQNAGHQLHSQAPQPALHLQAARVLRQQAPQRKQRRSEQQHKEVAAAPATLEALQCQLQTALNHQQHTQSIPQAMLSYAQQPAMQQQPPGPDMSTVAYVLGAQLKTMTQHLTQVQTQLCGIQNELNRMKSAPPTTVEDPVLQDSFLPASAAAPALLGIAGLPGDLLVIPHQQHLLCPQAAQGVLSCADQQRLRLLLSQQTSRHQPLLPLQQPAQQQSSSQRLVLQEKEATQMQLHQDLQQQLQQLQQQQTLLQMQLQQTEAHAEPLLHEPPVTIDMLFGM